jgi:hypothetical protein
LAKKAKIGQKGQNWPQRPKLATKAKIFKKKPKKLNLPKKSQNKLKLGFFGKFGFFGNIWLVLEFFGFFGKFWIFWNKFAVCHFGGYIRTT